MNQSEAEVFFFVFFHFILTKGAQSVKEYSVPKYIFLNEIHTCTYIYHKVQFVSKCFCSPSCYWTCVLLNNDLTKSCLVAAVRLNQRGFPFQLFIQLPVIHGHCLTDFVLVFLLHYHSLQCMLWMCIFYKLFFLQTGISPQCGIAWYYGLLSNNPPPNESQFLSIRE